MGLGALRELFGKVGGKNKRNYGVVQVKRTGRNPGTCNGKQDATSKKACTGHVPGARKKKKRNRGER